MKLSVWARRLGISYQTAWRWVKDDVMPVPWRQLPTGTILVDTSSDELVGGVALYARVGSHDQRADLDRQLARLSVYAAEQGLHVVESVSEVGSGLNGKRRALLRLLSDPRVETIVVEHRDRLARFGSDVYKRQVSSSSADVPQGPCMIGSAGGAGRYEATCVPPSVPADFNFQDLRKLLFAASALI